MTDWDGAKYAEIATLQHDVGRRFVAELTPPAGARVVDAGCGEGFVTRLIAELPPVAAVVGFDPSPLMIARAREGRHPGVDFVEGDVTTFVADDPFDLAVSLNALHWVPDSVAALTRLHDAVRPGAGVVCQFVPEGERPSIEDVAFGVATGVSTGVGTGAEGRDAGGFAAFFEGFEPPHVHRTRGEWRDIAGAAGLEVDDLTERDLAWDFGSADAFRAWCALGFTAYTDRLPAERRDEFLARVTDAYGRVTGSDHVLRFLQLRLGAHRPR
ncbi:methyltransferase domain-containing protein [Herbiconiux daphne]|uniref:Methyltransferase domain-containing protein n=1 Tax=Herbiconiux daphne TaxID=2970914 RepID=A0ABT2H1E0_9MICO|nr:methyltransferase domain-containing protein [Herbiconiux daphne]MCS5733742.1 methyltransferase domain-containing protein [Herbiconiux daphne]